jgi:hypothetical protein
MAGNQVGWDIDHVRFGSIAIGHEATIQRCRRACDGCQSSGNKTARAAFSRGQHDAPGRRESDNQGCLMGNIVRKQ